MLSTTTWPAAPPKIANPGCGCMAAVTAPFTSVQFGCVALQVPSPPPIWVALARPLPFQKFRTWAGSMLTRLTFLSPVRYWTEKLLGAAPPSAMPPFVRVSVLP
ncbi:hypothetical protein D9M72_548380 [compost metagenome]